MILLWFHLPRLVMSSCRGSSYTVRLLGCRVYERGMVDLVLVLRGHFDTSRAFLCLAEEEGAMIVVHLGNGEMSNLSISILSSQQTRGLTGYCEITSKVVKASSRIVVLGCRRPLAIGTMPPVY
jgi:hypothetical protein